MNINTMTSEEEELLDSRAQSILRHVLEEDTVITLLNDKEATDSSSNKNVRKLQTVGHKNEADEQDASDAAGFQGGQVWSKPTKVPTDAPSISSAPTKGPTHAPQLNSMLNTLRGVCWYDRNGNGVRDSNVEVEGYSQDVEFEFGVGGVSINLVECDPQTGE